MPLYKNTDGQKLAVTAIDTSTGALKTGDAANITAQISKDGGASAATNDANPMELDATNHPGVYVFDMLQAETNADLISLYAVSATGNVSCGDPQLILTQERPLAEANVELAAIPTTTSDLREMLQFLFEYFRNKRTATADTETLYKEDASTPLGTSTLSDDGTTFTKGELS